MAAKFKLTEVRFTPLAKKDYAYWEKQSPSTVARIQVLIAAALVDPDGGIGKPERLRHVEFPTWSRRINQRDRMIYIVEGKALVITQLGFHY